MTQGMLPEVREQSISPPSFDLWDEQCSIPSYYDQRRNYRTFGTVLKGVEEAVYVGADLGFWEPARIVEGAMNFKIKHPGDIDDAVGLVSGATQVAVGIHDGKVNLDALDHLGDFTRSSPSLRRSHIRDTRSGSDVRASCPEYSKATAKKLRKSTGDANLLIIVLGNTGIASGINTFLGYRNEAKNTDSAIYPVRLSGHKQRDTAPRVNSQEIDHLRALSAVMDGVVIFDENCATGFSLGLATNFFASLLDVEVIPAANQDHAKSGEPVIGIEALREIQQRSYNQHRLEDRIDELHGDLEMRSVTV